MKTVVIKANAEGELYIELDSELLAQLGWEVDTTLEWTVSSDNSVTVYAPRYRQHSIDAQL